MKINRDDPKLTAYALGEMDDAERAAVEAQINASPELRRIVDEIRETAGLLSQEMNLHHAAPGLTGEQREAIEAAAATGASADAAASAGSAGVSPAKSAGAPAPAVGGPVAATPSWLRRHWIPTSLAASLLLVGVLSYVQFMRPGLSRARESSKLLVIGSNIKWQDSVVGAYEMPASAPDLSAGSSAATPATQGPSPALAVGKNRARARRARGLARRPSPADRSRRRSLAKSSPSSLNKRQAVVDHTQAVATSSRIDRSDGQHSGVRHFLAPPFYGREGEAQDSTERGRAAMMLTLESVPASDIRRLVAQLRNERPAGTSSGGNDDETWRISGLQGPALSESVSSPNFDREAYDRVVKNPFLYVAQSPLSTFSIDVDTASYANVRRMLNQGMLPPAGAVRIEEMVNYFQYDYPPPTGDDPFSVNVEVADCPWNGQHRLVRIGLKGYEIAPDERPPVNLVFLIDVSGSMGPANKLPLLKKALAMLVEQLDYRDYVSMVVYAGASGLVLDPTSGSDRATIMAALDRLQSGGSTNGGAGIELAYQTAAENFVEGGVNRVILATDGDFNVGVTSQSDLVSLVEDRAKSGVFLSVLGFGMGNYQDSMLEKLADKGNGNYAYIDTLSEAEKVLVDQMGGTLFTIAKDVKIQIEFNPVEVNAYRLIGYENRILAARDFNDDTKDAGEIGAGHTVTALYEVVPVGVNIDLPTVDPLKYQTSDTHVRRAIDPKDEDARVGRVINPTDQNDADPAAATAIHGVANVAKPTTAALSGEMLTVKLRYKEPDGDTSKLIQVPVTDGGATLADSSDDFAWAASVASFAMLLRDAAARKVRSPQTADAGVDDADNHVSLRAQGFTMEAVREIAMTATGADPFGYRAEFVSLVDKAMALRP